ncbi:helix loop helix transcription factor [Cryphonectria parasitica EP155]|uniref:Helix loop helix transcription factor n=1 Tax=Cryphonectria parasitica (strain ATCC 38755 / EP155) TaxID=660469 RepID=A0A9P4YAW2_CRYP1|nr:helix loop helix transcription factor [Cryphonectria parasitica EP155]KAF3769645.1 helix loop helix transcription factor [Cryphonectria parasitica EP155]
MAQVAVANSEPNLAALTDSPPQKRKRLGESSPSDLRHPKRNTMGSPDPTDEYGSAIDTAQAAAAGVNVSDFNALQQAAAGADHSDATDPANASSTAAAALVYPTIHAPQPSEENFAAQLAVEERHHEIPHYGHDQDTLHLDHPVLAPAVGGQHNGVMRQDIPGVHRYSTPKPAVGSEEWHKMRKDNHKEVERRRRETINEGINELAKIVPGCEKNKGSILQNAVRYITKLKEDEQQAIEKWTLEKLLTEQAISELSTSNDKLKAECDRTYRELEAWKRVAESHGLSIDEGHHMNGGPDMGDAK